MTVQTTHLKLTPDLLTSQKQLTMPLQNIMLPNANTIPTFVQLLLNFMELLKTFDDNKPVLQKSPVRTPLPVKTPQKDITQSTHTPRQVTPLQTQQKSQRIEKPVEKKDEQKQEYQQVIVNDNQQNTRTIPDLTPVLQKPIVDMVRNPEQHQQPHLTQITPPQQSTVEQITLEENTNANQENIPQYEVRFKQTAQHHERQFTPNPLLLIKQNKPQQEAKQNQEFYNYLLAPAQKTPRQNNIKIMQQKSEVSEIQLPESQQIIKHTVEQHTQPQKDSPTLQIEHAKDVNLKIQDIEVHQPKENLSESASKHGQLRGDAIVQIASRSEKISIQKGNNSAKTAGEKIQAVGERSTIKAQKVKLPQKNPETVNQQKRIEFIQRLVKAARLARLKGYAKVKLMLYPPKLGNLRVDLHVKNKVLSGVLKVETNSAKEVILQNIETLRQELQKNGFNETYFNVLTFDNKAGSESTGDKAYHERHTGSGFAGQSDSDTDSHTLQIETGHGDKRIVDLIG